MNYLETAIRAAEAAGEIHKKYFKTRLRVQTKEQHFNRVSVADTEAEQEIIAVIKKDYPDHAILAEESGQEAGGTDYLWIIDPLDGTNNYLHTLPLFSVSIALAKNSEIQLGVVYNPLLDELFYAEKGKGAFLNRESISVSENPDLKSALLITGFYYLRDERMVETLENIRKFFLAGIIDIRRLGSAALDLCNIACGRADGYWEVLLNPWDFAAGKIIVGEAGGRVTDVTGEMLSLRPSSIVATNNRVHTEMLEVLAG